MCWVFLFFHKIILRSGVLSKTSAFNSIPAVPCCLCTADIVTVSFLDCLETLPASSWGIFKQYWPLAIWAVQSTPTAFWRVQWLPGSNGIVWSFEDGERSQNFIDSIDYSNSWSSIGTPPLSGRRQPTQLDSAIVPNWTKFSSSTCRICRKLTEWIPFPPHSGELILPCNLTSSAQL